jgi:hypothetical protein
MSAGAVPGAPAGWIVNETAFTTPLRGWDTEAPYHRVGSGWHPAANGRDGVMAWVVPSAPDTDFAVTYQVQSKAGSSVVVCVFGTGCAHEFDYWDEVVDYTDPTEATIHYDVMPGTLDGLLGWTAVVTRLDPDGDGLVGAADAWPSNPDKDGDGVPDGYEAILLEIPAGHDADQDGNPDGPAVFDSDDDGLSDGRELALRTALLLADTDGDGLEDGEETAGWDVSFTFRGQAVTAHVTSDPARTDSDSGGAMLDGLNDLAERDAGLNPRSRTTQTVSPTRLMPTRTA